MGIEVASSFTRKAAVPLDELSVAADETARDAIPSGVRYQGMLVYLIAEQVMYQLQGGITNSDWYVAGGGGGGASTPVVDLATGDGFFVSFNLTVDPGTKENVAVYIDGVRQSTTEYSIVAGDIEFNTAPYNGAVLMFITGAVNVVNVPAVNSVTTNKIADNAVTTSKLIDGSVTVSKLASNSVTTSKIADGSVTPVKMAARTFSSSGNVSYMVTGVSTTIPGLTCTITATGRPVFVGLVGASGFNSNIRTSVSSGSSILLQISIVENGITAVCSYTMGIDILSTSVHPFHPTTSVNTTYIPTAGTKTYTVIAQVSGTGTLSSSINAVNLIAYEL